MVVELSHGHVGDRDSARNASRQAVNATISLARAFDLVPAAGFLWRRRQYSNEQHWWSADESDRDPSRNLHRDCDNDVGLRNPDIAAHVDRAVELLLSDLGRASRVRRAIIASQGIPLRSTSRTRLQIKNIDRRTRGQQPGSHSNKRSRVPDRPLRSQRSNSSWPIARFDCYRTPCPGRWPPGRTTPRWSIGTWNS